MIMLTEYQHLSADQVLAKVNENGAAVSKATVYNTLGLFAERGIVREVIVDPTKVFYDSNTAPHHHFYNVDDGTLTDFPAEQLEVSNIPEAPVGTVADRVDVIVRVRSKAPAGLTRALMLFFMQHVYWLGPETTEKVLSRLAQLPF
jgi:Fur family iron response transcriptional regulator